MKKGWNLALPAALVLAGIAAIGYIVAMTFGASRSDTWGQQRAKVESVSGANVTYSYEAGGRTHRATQTVRGTYPAGAAILVYVNPTNAAESLLQLPPRPAVWPAFAGAMAILFGAALAVFFMRESQPQQRKKTLAAKKPVRRAAPPMSRLRPPPAVKRAAPAVHEDATAAD